MVIYASRRVVTAAALILTTAVAIFLGKISTMLLLCLMGVLVQYELTNMLLANSATQRGFAIVLGQILLLVWLRFAKQWYYFDLCILLAVLLLLAVPAGKSLSRQHKLGLLVGLICYTSRGLACLYLLYSASTAWVVLVLIATCSSDTFAYLVGRRFGRHSLWPAMSKNKTWEGLYAGMCGAVALPALTWLLARSMDWPAWQYVAASDMLVVSVICAVVAPLGDLCESKLKRIAQIKDSGQILPGHGGMLDRIDGLLPCAIATWAWLCVVGQ
ncbi:MAG: phosphatidate cytidylyltransferase [Myxococcota bacterium]